MMTLADLSRQMPNEHEVSKLFDLMRTESDRGSALVAGSFVEAAVHMAVAAHLVADDDVLSPVFHSFNAPLGSFSAKIRMAHALGVYGSKTAAILNAIKDIRNAFAHALRPLDFRHPTIVRAVKALDPAPFPVEQLGLAPARVRYLHICQTLFGLIYRIAQNRGDKEITVELS